MQNINFTKKEKQSFIKYWNQSVKQKEVFEGWKSYAHHLLTNLQIDPEKIRMALRSSPLEAMIIVGMPNVLTYKEENSTAVVGFLTTRNFLDNIDVSLKHHSTFNFADDFNLERFEITDWTNIPNKLLEHHKAQVSLLYDRVKDSKLADWNKEASTTNNFLKNIIYSNNSMIVQDDIHKIDFFKKQEFEVLQQTRGQKYNKENPEQLKQYNFLAEAYIKNQYWANQIKRDLFPNGVEKTVKKPTNQGNKFDGYLWSRIYPSQEDLEVKWLAFTIGIAEHHFEVKIDTVGLDDNDTLRQKYFKERGDFFSSELVCRYPFESITGWLDLIRRTKQDIKKLMPHYERLKGLAKKSSTSNPSKYKTTSNIPLNQILYGPPGTGKTYATKEKAVRIANPDYFKLRYPLTPSRKELVEEYNRLYSLGQIVFTTFHQSLSYEDFVEGIKPNMLDAEEGDLGYNIENGIFKKLCFSASQTKKSNNFDSKYKEFVDKVTENPDIELYTPVQKRPFNLSINSNETAVAIPQTEKATRMGITKHMLYEYIINNVIIDWKPYTVAIGEYIREDFKINVQKVDDKVNNHVLIIDEINRGNVSAIFGELITLLEEDKRKGNDEEISVDLPYSKKAFTVPPNLYIIGTMNTADRSVEALDTALRRRFTFEEIMPKPELLSPAYQYWQLLWEYKDVMWENAEFKEKEQLFFESSGASEELIANRKIIWSGFEDQGTNQNQVQEFEKYEFDGLRLDRILQTINSRIEALLDRDHTIGHSYFFKVKDAENKERALKQVFKDSIIPLLQEYFYGDYSRIGLVLGEGFIEVMPESKDNLFANFNKKDNDVEVSESFKIKIIGDDFDMEAALNKLMNRA